MAVDCLVVSFGTTNLAKQYIVKSGDTLVAIAKKHGFADWREIYNHPDNLSFKTKRPNPDKIFPGDILNIPGQSSTDIPSLPQTGGGGFGFARVPLLLNLRGPKPSDFDLDFKHPGNVKLRVAFLGDQLRKNRFRAASFNQQDRRDLRQSRIEPRHCSLPATDT